MRIVVVGASGAVGQKVAHAARERFPDAELVLTARSIESAKRVAALHGGISGALDMHDAGAVRSTVDGADLVLIAAPQRTPIVQQAAVDARAHCVDVHAGAELARSVTALDANARDVGRASVVMGGLLPGLSGMLARQVGEHAGEGAPIDVLFRQSANAAVGPAGAEEMLRIVSAPVGDGPGTARPGFQERHRSERSFRRIAHPEAEILRENDTTGIRYWTAWDRRSQNGLVSMLTRMRLLPRLAPLLARAARHNPAKPENIELTVRTGEGPVIRLTAAADYTATADAALAFGQAAVAGHGTGAGHPATLFTLDTIHPLLQHVRLIK